MTKRVMSSIKAAITRFDKAAQEYAFKGSQAPEAHTYIDQEYALSRESLERMIEGSLR